MAEHAPVTTSADGPGGTPQDRGVGARGLANPGNQGPAPKSVRIRPPILNDRHAVGLALNLVFRPIAERPRPVPKPRKTWRRLEVGRQLDQTAPPPGPEWPERVTVASVDSQGVWLDVGTASPRRWEDPDWPEFWVKVKKRPTRKKQKENQSE